mmetsp:Transcript_32060/g.72091  ORF Transcript_32060/g.72091 Transcript_32060/m.72091 type:complete len:629 (+) Transcript_32060:52-1938(+)
MSGGNAHDAQVSASELDQLFHFLQCQLRMEAKECLQQDVELLDQQACALWPHFVSWVQPNLGKKEKWMPFHTVLGAHELFIVENIHHNSKLNWDEKSRFLAMFVFRAHCRGHVFRDAQLPVMQKKGFWRDPISYFKEDGEVTRSMLAYRRKTKQPLQTSAFLAIPERLCQEDSDENLALNVAMRTRTLLEVADRVWPILHNNNMPSLEKFEEISRTIQSGRGLGETWAKMLMVSIDIAYPKAQLLSHSCDVGVGALKALQRLFHGGCPSDLREALRKATRKANESQRRAARNFWSMLGKVENLAQNRFAKFARMLAQVSTPTGQLSAVTMQVQLCEWRQFMDYLAKVGAPFPRLVGEPADLEPAMKRRRLNGKKKGSAEQLKDDDGSDDDLPLSDLPRLQEVARPPLQNLSRKEAAHLELAREAMETLKADLAWTKKEYEAARRRLGRSVNCYSEAAKAAEDARSRNSKREEELRVAELAVTAHAERMKLTQWNMDFAEDVYKQFESSARRKILEETYKMPGFAERLPLASRTRQALHNQFLEDMFKEFAEPERRHAELQEELQEFMDKSQEATAALKEAKDEVKSSVQALEEATSEYAQAREETAMHKAAMAALEVQVVELSELIAD